MITFYSNVGFEFPFTLHFVRQDWRVEISAPFEFKISLTSSFFGIQCQPTRTLCSS